MVSVFYPSFELSDAVLLLAKTAVTEEKPVEIPSLTLTLCVDPLLTLFTRDVIAQGCQCARVVRYLHSCVEGGEANFIAAPKWSEVIRIV